MLIIDLAGAPRGAERATLERLREVDAKDFVGSGLLFCLPGAIVGNIQSLSGDVLELVEIEPERAADNAMFVRSVLKRVEEARNARDAVTVFTYNPALKAVISGLRQSDPEIKLAMFASAPRAEIPWPSTAEWMTIDSAAREVGEALRGRGRVRATDLRGLLQSSNSLWKKEPGSPSATPGLIGKVINHAEARGLIRVTRDGGSSGNPWIEDAGTSILSQRVSPLERTASSNYVTCLRDHSFGPFMQVRWNVYDEMERRASVSFGAQALVEASVSAVQVEHDDMLSKEKPFPWVRLRLLIVKLLQHSDALLGEGLVIHHDFCDAKSIVTGLADDWRFALDSVLVTHLLENGFEFGFEDSADLAGALYDGRDSERVDRTMDLLSYMVKTEKAVENPEVTGKLVLKPVP
jgi:hypothetical protein